MKKVIALALSALVVSGTALAGSHSGFCTREYDPVPYVTKDGKVITAPNPCVAEHWKSQGR